MRLPHPLNWLTIAALAIVFARGIEGQMATSGPIPADSLSLPSPPPFLTLLGMASPGKFVTDPSIPPKGPVSEVLYEELRGTATPAGAAGTVVASRRTKFDQQGHLTEQIENRWGTESDTVYSYQNGRLVSMETTFPTSQKARPKAWGYWSYDSSGKLMEYRRGGGSELQNHELNFKHDVRGRLLAFEYRQGADDKPFSRTEISYSDDGKTIGVSRRFLESKIVDRSTRVLDEQSRTVRVVLVSEGRAPNDEAKNIRFRYDEKGRVVEQTTDATKFSDSGAEQDLPPGTISIVYDDAMHTKTTKYSFAGEGTMQIVLTQDENGATIAYSMDTASERGFSKFECEYDGHANWTSCTQFVEQEGRQFVKQRCRRTITYREGH